MLFFLRKLISNWLITMWEFECWVGRLGYNVIAAGVMIDTARIDDPCHQVKLVIILGYF